MVRVLSSDFGFAGDWEKIGARMSVGVGGGIFLSPPPPPSPIFLPPSHWLGKLFTSPQLSTVFLIQDGGLNNRWEYPLARPAEIRLHCRLVCFLHLPSKGGERGGGGEVAVLLSI